MNHKRYLFVNFPFLSFPRICWPQKEFSDMLPCYYYWMEIVKDECNFCNFEKNSLVKTLRPSFLCEGFQDGFNRSTQISHFAFLSVLVNYGYVIESHLSAIDMSFSWYDLVTSFTLHKSVVIPAFSVLTLLNSFLSHFYQPY
jgi:hypothetical protein